MKEVDKALADQKVSGRRMVIEEVEGSEDEEPASTTGQGLSNGVESSEERGQEAVNHTGANPTQQVLVDSAKEECCMRDSEQPGRNVQGAGDADAVATEAGSQTQTQPDTADGAATSPDDNMPPAVLALKDAGNDLFRKGQYGDALDKYNAAVQLLG